MMLHHLDFVEMISNPNISSSDYKDLYPLFLFDVSKQSERLKYSITDIQIKAMQMQVPKHMP